MPLQSDETDAVQQCLQVALTNGRMCLQHPEVFGCKDAQSIFFEFLETTYQSGGECEQKWRMLDGPPQENKAERGCKPGRPYGVVVLTCRRGGPLPPPKSGRTPPP